MQAVFQKYFEILLSMFQYDMEVFSKPWLYYTVLPVIGYLIFFFVKWIVLTTPFWMPFSMILGVARSSRRKKDNKNKD